jgi:hypothetical protein
MLDYMQPENTEFRWLRSDYDGGECGYWKFDDLFLFGLRSDYYSREGVSSEAARNGFRFFAAYRLTVYQRKTGEYLSCVE